MKKKKFISDKKVDAVFNGCVDILEWTAKKTNSTYNRVNVWTFCVVAPLIFTASVALNVVLATKLMK